MGIPTEKELLEYIGSSHLVNYSKIASKFNINIASVSDFLKSLLKKRLIKIERVGSNKFVRVRK